MRQSGNAAETNCPIKSKDGTIKIGSIGACLLDISDSASSIILIDDITKRVKAEQQLIQAQKIDAVGQLASGIAHDFNNMLGAILGASEILGRQLDPASQPQKLNNIITRSSQRAAGLIARISSFIRNENITFSTIDIHSLINETVSVLRSTVDRRISIHVDNQATKSIISGHGPQIHSALMNLGINASHAINEAGTITIRTYNQTYREGENDHLSQGEYLCIDFMDTGSGIPNDTLQQIFEPFFTTKPQGKGTGLGLSSTLQAIQDHQGDISVQSTIDRGTTFHITLPLEHQGSHEHQKEISLDLSSDANKGCVLVVDDEMDMRETTITILQGLGYHTLSAVDGEHALSIYSENQENIVLVLLDMVMPRMDGLSCFKELKLINPDIKTIIVSGFCSDEDLSSMNKMGVWAISKNHSISTP